MNKLDLIKDFSKLFEFKSEEKISEEGWVGFSNPAFTIMVIPKLKSIKNVITDNFDVTQDMTIPSLNYNIQMIEGDMDKVKVIGRLAGGKTEIVENSVKFSPELMKVILKLCTKTQSENILFKFRREYPLWAETDEMIIILAPRVDI